MFVVSHSPSSRLFDLLVRGAFCGYLSISDKGFFSVRNIFVIQNLRKMTTEKKKKNHDKEIKRQ